MTHPTTASVAPHPPRYYWLKRLGAAALIAALLLIGLRLAWGHRANSRLAATIAAIEAAGEPIHFHDLVIESVPDQDNKAYHLRQAISNWPTVPGLGVVVTDTDWHSSPSNHPDPITDNAAYLQQLDPILDHLRRADAASGCDWGVRPQSPIILHWQAPPYGEMRRLARLIEDAARRAHAIDDAQRASELTSLAMSIGQAANHEYPMIIGHLVRISIHALACGIVEEITPTLDIPPGDNPTRRQAQALLDRLMDITDMQKSLTRGYLYDRWMAGDAIDSIFDGHLGITQLHYGGNPPGLVDHLIAALFKPVYVNDAVFWLDYQGAAIEASRSSESLPHFTQAMSSQHNLLNTIMEQHRILHPITSVTGGAYDATARSHYMTSATQRMAATALAIRLYETDHGRRPDTLDELVPDYLPAVPLDPYTRDQPIGYRPQGARLVEQDVWGRSDQGTRPYEVLPFPGPAIVYCVGRSGVDHGGLILLNRDGTIDESNRLREEGTDHWFLLDPRPDAYALPGGNQPSIDLYDLFDVEE